jgi:hypothetical protein
MVDRTRCSHQLSHRPRMNVHSLPLTRCRPTDTCHLQTTMVSEQLSEVCQQLSDFLSRSGRTSKVFSDEPICVVSIGRNPSRFACRLVHVVHAAACSISGSDPFGAGELDHNRLELNTIKMTCSSAWATITGRRSVRFAFPAIPVVAGRSMQPAAIAAQERPREESGGRVGHSAPEPSSSRSLKIVRSCAILPSSCLPIARCLPFQKSANSAKLISPLPSTSTALNSPSTVSTAESKCCGWCFTCLSPAPSVAVAVLPRCSAMNLFASSASGGTHLASRVVLCT